MAIIGAVSRILCSRRQRLFKAIREKRKSKGTAQVKVLETTSDVALRIAEMNVENAKIYSKECIGSEK